MAKSEPYLQVWERHAFALDQMPNEVVGGIAKAMMRERFGFGDPMDVGVDPLILLPYVTDAAANRERAAGLSLTRASVGRLGGEAKKDRPQPPSMFDSPPQPTGANPIDQLFQYWNSMDHLPECKDVSATIHVDKRSAILDNVKAYGLEDMKAAADALARNWDRMGDEKRPTMADRFFSESFKRWVPSQKPDDRYKDSGPQLGGADLVRKRRAEMDAKEREAVG